MIYEELCLGVVRERRGRCSAGSSAGSWTHGAQGVVLGCTELGLLVGPEDSPVPLLDTTRLHAEAGVALALDPLEDSCTS